MSKVYKIVKLLFCLTLLTIGNTSAVDFNNINQLYNISIRETNSVCKDDDGFVWVASKMGIIRLTSDNCKIYQLPYEESNILTVKLAYRNNQLIAYCNSGQIFIYNQITDKFELMINITRTMNRYTFIINKLTIDKNNKIWIASTSGLYALENNQLKVIRRQRNIDNLDWYDDNTIIIIERNTISFINIEETHKTIMEIDAPAPNTTKTSVYCDSKNNSLWLGTKTDGLYKINLSDNSCTEFQLSGMPKIPFLALKPLNDSILLAGTDGQGVCVIDIRTNKIIDKYINNKNNPKSLASNGVYDILCEPDTRVWVCTYDDGVSFYNTETKSISQYQHQINEVNSLNDNHVNDIYEDRNGNLWFATNTCISRYNPTTNKWKHIFPEGENQSLVFLSVCGDDKGQIWAGTYSFGLYVFSNDGKLLHHYSSSTNDNFNNDFVFDLTLDRNSDIWIGGANNDIYRFNHKTQKFVQYSYEALNAFAELDSTRMLLACVHGLVMLNKYTGDKSIIVDSNIVNDVFVQDGLVWLATHGNGLLKLELATNKITHYGVSDGLPSNFVTSIIYADGYLWLGTEAGLCKFNNKIGKGIVFPAIPQLQIAFNRNARFKQQNGNLIWGTNSGAVALNPKAKLEDQANGKIFIQDINIAGSSIRDIDTPELQKPVNQLDGIELKYTQNTIRVELVAIGNIASPRFSWKMEGIDNEWSQPTTNPIISYSNIPSQATCLKIKLYDSSMQKIIDERQLNINITPAFWHTWWFMLICYLLIFSLIASLALHYINVTRRRHNEDKIRFFTSTAHDMRTAITMIKAPIEELKNEKRLTAQGNHYLEIASEQANMLSMVVTQLMDFQKTDVTKEKPTLAMTDIIKLIKNQIQMFESLAKASKIDIEFKHNKEEYQSAVDGIMIDKIVDNLLSNAIKYSPNGGNVLVEFKGDDKMWQLSITDHGIGINKKAQKHLFTEFYRSDNAINNKILGSGIGLMLVKNYVELHGGKIKFESEENIGSTFTINIPYKIVENIATEIVTTRKSTNSAHHNERAANKKQLDTLLIVDDNTNLLNFMVDALSSDFKTVTATSGVEAWQKIEEQQPDIILSDIMIPEMDGFELCRKIKTTYETAHIPIILLTALSERTNELKGLGLGADDYLTKPFDIGILRQKLKTILRNRQLSKSKLLNSLSLGQPTELGNRQNDDFIQRLHTIVKTNINNTNFSKEQFAAEMNVSTSLLYKKMKSLLDTSPTDFIRIVRLEYAQQLLKTHEYNITEISEMCGFTSAAYFSTVYKKQYGVPPSNSENA